MYIAHLALIYTSPFIFPLSKGLNHKWHFTCCSLSSCRFCSCCSFCCSWLSRSCRSDCHCSITTLFPSFSDKASSYFWNKRWFYLKTVELFAFSLSSPAGFILYVCCALIDSICTIIIICHWGLPTLWPRNPAWWGKIKDPDLLACSLYF